MIVYASQCLTLRPGELLGSGTATGGSGLELDRWLCAGDLIEMHADGVGILQNRVGPKPA
jgi:2-keto-4-pentenoate hydratase/2-oxohepta-3-ene-1,7-dioic acid hydratase in catechol pathway